MIEDTKRIRCVDMRLELVYGCAMWGVPNYYGNMPYIHMGNSTGHDTDGNTVLWHELKHLICSCDFHAKNYIGAPKRDNR
jgi:hypothetical protein